MPETGGGAFGELCECARQVLHDEERGDGSFDIAVKGLNWLSENGFQLNIAGRARREGIDLEVRHVAELLSGDLYSPAIGEGD